MIYLSVGEKNSGARVHAAPAPEFLKTINQGLVCCAWLLRVILNYLKYEGADQGQRDKQAHAYCGEESESIPETRKVTHKTSLWLWSSQRQPVVDRSNIVPADPTSHSAETA